VACRPYQGLHATYFLLLERKAPLVNKKSAGYLLATIGSVCLMVSGAIFSSAIEVRQKETKDSDIPDEVKARVYAFQYCLMKKYNGGYEEDCDDEEITNDFEFAKIEYYLKR
jgi:hypothetical protein